MRYSRNIKIFRGGVDAAPFAGVFFLMVLFTMLFYADVFFPGVPIQLTDAEGAPEMLTRTARVLASDSIEFLGTTYDLDEFKRELQSRAQKGSLPKRILFETEPQAKSDLAAEVETLLKAAGIALKLPGTRLDLPDDAGFPGASNPLVVVGINLNGQLFFQHQLISDTVLQERLTAAAQHARPAPLTVLLQADKNVPLGRVTRLAEIARRAGIGEFRLATKPSPASASN